MRKIFALICVFTLLFTLSACSSSEAELYEKYKDVILALENNNFDGAINKIENLESERNQNLSSTESALSKEETFWQQEIVGKWIPDEDATAEGYTGLVINSDKTCTANGENYTWTVTYANETNAEIDLYKDKEKKCKLFFSLNSKRGYKRATIGMYQDEYYAPNLKGAYFAEEDYTVVNITKDNWQEYFEKTETITTGKNAFGEVNEFKVEMQFRLREEHSPINFELSKCAVEYNRSSVSQKVTVDLNNLTYTLGGKVENTATNDQTSTLVCRTDDNDKEYFAMMLGGFNVYDVNKTLTHTTWVPIEHEVLRIEGKLYIVKK